MAKFKTSIIEDSKDPSKPLRTLSGAIVRRPLLKVELLDPIGDAPFATRAIVDSGADVTIVNAEFALALGIDLAHTPEIEVKGIYNEAIRGRPANVKVRLVDLRDEIELPAIFVYSDNVNILLGREGFFEKFNIRFCISRDFFEIKKSG